MRQASFSIILEAMGKRVSFELAGREEQALEKEEEAVIIIIIIIIIIIKMDLREVRWRAWTGSIWLRIEIGGRLL